MEEIFNLLLDLTPYRTFKKMYLLSLLLIYHFLHSEIFNSSPVFK